MKVIFGVTSERSYVLRAFSSKQRAEAFIKKYDLYHDEKYPLVVREFTLERDIPLDHTYPCYLVNVFCNDVHIGDKVINNYNIVSVDPYNAIKLFNDLTHYNYPYLNVLKLDDDSSPVFAAYKVAYQRNTIFEIVSIRTHRFITKTLGDAYIELTLNDGETVDEFIIRAGKELDELLADKEKKVTYMQSLERKYFKPKETFDGLEIMNSMIRRDPE